MLYAPTYRDDAVDRRGRFRLEWRLDLERVRQALGPDTVLLVRKHYEIVDALPAGVHDVSRYPDGTELLAAAEELVDDGVLLDDRREPHRHDGGPGGHRVEDRLVGDEIAARVRELVDALDAD